MPLSRRRFFFGSFAVPALAAQKPAGELPNIVLILVDGLPSWILGRYGNTEVRTPNIDRLSQTGTRFLNHFVCAPVAGPSRAVLLTGRTTMQLHDAGFTVLPGPVNEGDLARFAQAYDRAVSTADPADVSIRSSTRDPDQARSLS